MAYYLVGPWEIFRESKEATYKLGGVKSIITPKRILSWRYTLWR